MMDKMTDSRAVEVLAAHNEWRRYDGFSGEPGAPAAQHPTEIGLAIDHAIARLLESAEAQAQGGGEVNMDVQVRDGTWVGTYAEWCRRKQIVPPSAPVGAEGLPPPFGYIEPRQDLSGYEVFDDPGPRRAAIWNLHGMQQTLAPQPATHPDDAAVDAFAAAMKEKLAAARAKGRCGWNGDEPGMRQRLSDMLRAHVEKGDPRDVANFAMFLHQRGEAILPTQQPAAVDGAIDVLWRAVGKADRNLWADTEELRDAVGVVTAALAAQPGGSDNDR